MAYINYNANPCNRRVGDCVTRAICTALDEEWEKVYVQLCLYGLMECDMPTANNVWGAYLRDNGFIRTTAPEDMTVKEFCEMHPGGTYLLALQNHLLCVKDGNYLDIWDSGDEMVLFFWMRI